jgi:hypothetical protein
MVGMLEIEFAGDLIARHLGGPRHFVVFFECPAGISTGSAATRIARTIGPTPTLGHAVNHARLQRDETPGYASSSAPGFSGFAFSAHPFAGPLAFEVLAAHQANARLQFKLAVFGSRLFIIGSIHRI